MGQDPQIDFTKYEAPAAIDFSKYEEPSATPTVTAAPAMGISAGPGWMRRKWNEVKAGLASAQESGGLKEQPTFIGNAAAGTGMLASIVSQLAPSDIAEAGGAVKTAVADMMPAERIAKAKNLFQRISGSIGSNAVQMTDSMKTALDEIKEAKDLGAGGGAIADKVMSRLTNSEAAPLTFDEARTLYSNLGNMTSSDKMASNKNMLRLLRNFQSELGGAIESVAETGGMKAAYKEAMSEFAKGSTHADRLDKIVKYGLAAAGTSATGALAREGWKLHQALFGD